MKLDDGTVRWFDGGGAPPAVLKAPGHIDLRADRASLKGEVGNRRVERFVAVGTDGHQFEDKVPQEWRAPASWPD
jgi:hypothetical protein